MDHDDLKKILSAHKKWVDGVVGEMADLGGANLSGANLRWANLSWANLSEATLREANLSGADLREADLGGANLRWANLSEADLRWANLSEANLSEANLREANLSGADLSGAGLKIYQSGLWTAYVLKDRIMIGCQLHDTSKWESFSDEQIALMHGEALPWWKENGQIVLSISQSIAGLGPWAFSGDRNEQQNCVERC